MRRTRTTELIVETEEIVVVSARVATDARAARGWCAACGTEVLLFTPEAAAAAAGLTPRAVYRLIEARQLHFNETDTGQLFVCLASLVEQRDAGASLTDR